MVGSNLAIPAEIWDELEQLERLHSEIPPAAPWLPILVIHIRSQVKTTQSQSYKFKKLSKFQILQATLHATHLLKLLYKMHKYEMDPTRTVEATERTRDAGRTRDGRTETNIPPQQLLYNYRMDKVFKFMNRQMQVTTIPL